MNYETGTPELLAEVTNSVGILTLNRPDRRNALYFPVIDALASVLAEWERDPTIGAIVITGAGSAFSAGGDIKVMSNDLEGREAVSYDIAVHEQRLRQRATTERLMRMPKITIAAIPGAAAGMGLSLALACDLRYASRSAVLTTAFGKVGLSGDYGASWLLTQIVGSARARQMLYFSEIVSADDAKAIGLINDVFADDDLLDGARQRAEQIAAGPLVAYRYMKENLNRAMGDGLRDAMDLEVTHHFHFMSTADHREATSAFVEKRPPRFRGR